MSIVLLAAGTASAQVPNLTLDPNDVRLEAVVSNGVITGYNLFVRKKSGMESVMLTEPDGYHALRSTEWNSVNGGERRELFGSAINDFYSRFSILSSTPIQDQYFGAAFLLFVPPEVIYGNPSSPAGMVSMRVTPGFHLNIRTFERKYADPSNGRYQNNLYMVEIALVDNAVPPMYQSEVPQLVAEIPMDSTALMIAELREILICVVGISENTLNSIGGDLALQLFLRNAFNNRQ